MRTQFVTATFPLIKIFNNNFNNNNKLYCPVYQNDKLNSNINAYIENDVRVAINKCSTSFCYIETKTAAGWIDKSNLFGILLNEKF